MIAAMSIGDRLMINLFDDIPARSADEIFTQVLVRRNGGVNAFGRGRGSGPNLAAAPAL